MPTTFPVERWLQEEAAAGHREVAVDAAAVVVPSSLVLVALSMAARDAAELGLHLHVANAGPRLRAALQRLGFAQLGLQVDDIAA